MLPNRASSPIRSNETIRSRLIKDSDSFRSRAQELEILNILNWPEVMWSVLQSISLPPRTAPIATGWNEQLAGRVYPHLRLID